MFGLLTGLHESAENDHHAVVDLLLALDGILINAHDKAGLTPSDS